MSQQKGMNLEQFKRALSSDATKRAETMEKTIKDLHTKIREKDAQLTQRKEMCRVLFNRCFATSHGMMCLFCDQELKKTCKAERTVAKEDSAP